MIVGEKLRQLRNELAYLDHDLVVDGAQALIYCVHCHEGENYVLTSYGFKAFLAIARNHQVTCAWHRGIRAQEDANEGT